MGEEQHGGVNAFKALRPHLPAALSPFETSDFLVLLLLAYSPSRVHAQMVLGLMERQVAAQPEAFFGPERMN